NSRWVFVQVLLVRLSVAPMAAVWICGCHHQTARLADSANSIEWILRLVSEIGLPLVFGRWFHHLFYSLTNSFSCVTSPMTNSSRNIPSSVANCSTGFFNLGTSR